MQTLEFTRALKDILRELKVDDLLTLIQPWLIQTPQQATVLPQESKIKLSALLFDSHSGYQRLFQRANTRVILEQFQVGRFYAPGGLMVMIANISNIGSINQIAQNSQLFTTLTSFVELLRSFQRMVAACTTLLETAKIGEIPSSDGILVVELINYADEIGVSPQRLEIFLKNITGLHTSLTLVYGISTDKLTFKYLDSGSGFVFGIQCAKNIAEAMNTVLTQWWDKIRFWRFDTFEKRMDAISKALDVSETIHLAVDRGTIDKETGDNLKVRIFQHVDNLIGIGATVPLPEATIDQQQLLTEMRNTKLLGSGEPQTPSGTRQN